MNGLSRLNFILYMRFPHYYLRVIWGCRMQEWGGNLQDVRILLLKQHPSLNFSVQSSITFLLLHGTVADTFFLFG